VPDEPEHDVEVVNHQIEHDINVERAGGELADAVYLEVDGVADVRPECDERRVEAFEVADLKERAAALGRLNHPVGLFERARDGLLDEDVDARLQQLAGDVGVRLGRRGEAHGVHPPGERAPVGRPDGLALGGDVAGRRFVEVADGDEVRLPFGGERGVDARVLAAKVADADAGGTERQCFLQRELSAVSRQLRAIRFRLRAFGARLPSPLRLARLNRRRS
jgi:hypothetical protein